MSSEQKELEKHMNTLKNKQGSKGKTRTGGQDRGQSVTERNKKYKMGKGGMAQESFLP